MTDTTPALDLDAIRERHARAERFGGVALRAEVCDDVPGMLDELATLRCELAEARAETAAAKKALDDERHAELSDAVRNLDAVSNGYRWLKALRDGLAQRGIPTTQWRDVTPTALARLDEAVAETARVRTVWREAAQRLADEYEIALGHARGRPGYWGPEHDRIVRVYEEFIRRLRAALDGAATTGPQTTPAPRQDDEQPPPKGSPRTWRGGRPKPPELAALHKTWDAPDCTCPHSLRAIPPDHMVISWWRLDTADDCPHHQPPTNETPRTPTVAEWGGAS